MWGLGIIGFGFASSLPLAVLGLVVAGGADMVSGLFRTTMWNQSIPDSLRGRLAGIEMLSYSSGPDARQCRVRACRVFCGVACLDRLGRRACACWAPSSWLPPAPLLELRLLLEGVRLRATRGN